MTQAVDLAIDQVLVVHRNGRFGEAEKRYLDLLESAPSHPELLHLIGVVALQTDRPSRAVDYLQQAIAVDPGQARYHNNYGNAVKAVGNGDGAEAAYRRALALDPDFASAHSNLALLQLERGAVMTALSGFDRAVELDPSLADAHCNGGHALQLLGRQKQAVNAFSQAVIRQPDRDDYWVAFADAVSGLKPVDVDSPVAGAIVDMLQRLRIDHQHLAGLIAGLLVHNPAIGPWMEAGAGAGVRSGLDAAADIPLLNEALPRLVFAHPALERALGNMRAAMLQMTGETPSAAILSLAAGLAANAYLVDYIWEETPDETASVEQLIGSFKWSEDTADDTWRSAFAAAVIGAYRPLWALDGLPDIVSVADPVADRAIAAMMRIHVEEPRDEATLRSTLPTDGLAEAPPYPRWRSINFLTPRTVMAELRRQFPNMPLKQLTAPSAPRVLVPDCGTGRSVIDALWRFEPARLLGTDDNEANLAYARRMAAQFGVADRMEFAQNAEDTASGDDRYDVILAAHATRRAADPMAVCQHLLDRLAPGGAMKVALLSEAGRAGVTAARATFAERGFSRDPAGLRAFRRHVLEADGDSAAQLVGFTDFYSATGCQELLLTEQERCFSLPELALALDELGVLFLGLEHTDPRIAIQYAERYPDDPQRTHLGNWAEWEAEQPTLFGAAYQAWVLKS